jgi:hypothetical protein
VLLLHSTRIRATRKRLDEINPEFALHDSELRSLDAAIEEAGKRLCLAQHPARPGGDGGPVAQGAGWIGEPTGVILTRS